VDSDENMESGAEWCLMPWWVQLWLLQMMGYRYSRVIKLFPLFRLSIACYHRLFVWTLEFYFSFFYRRT
jgi:hypothetical protein